MSHCISKFSVSHPLASQRASSNYPSSCNVSRVIMVPVSGKNGRTRTCRAMATADSRDSLDHMQRQTKTQPKRRPAQVTAPIGLWDRFPTARTVQQMMDTMDRLIEDPLAFNNGGWSSSSSPAMPPENGGYRRGRTPWEIKEGEGEYKMRFDMPGMSREDVKVWVEEKMLVLKAEKAPKEEEEWSAKSYGRYSSRIALPENVEYEKIRAEVKDGVLYITIPKASVSGKVFDINVE
ncbi:PREDICTED: small heat shock protein, chloroplastic-like [Ipomoea nil]|uniref:small heat shock protein, chloroplastic-like n=1 Tax=Ipomoea nil TaxID=35883 RepID=UPI000901E565|nr:PREDICTED: small heat shock protein, chloroplastic-like [Ipomoea nil]